MKRFAMGAALALFALQLSGCSEDDAAAAKDKMGSALDSAKEAAGGAMGDLTAMADKAKNSLGDLTSNLSSLSAEDIQSRVGDVVTSITSAFDTVKDKASAESVVEQMKNALGGLEKVKGMLADKMPDLSALKDAAASLKEKFAGKTEILDALKPLMDQIKSLTGS